MAGSAKTPVSKPTVQSEEKSLWGKIKDWIFGTGNDSQLGPGAVDWPSSGSGSGGSSSGSGSGSKKSSSKTCVLKVIYSDTDSDDGEPPLESIETYKGKKKAVTLSAEVKDNEDGLTKSDYYFAGWKRTYTSGCTTTVELYKPGSKIEKTWSNSASGTTTYNLDPNFVNSGNYFIYLPDSNTKETLSTYQINHYMPHTGFPEGNNDWVEIAGAIFTRTGYTQTGWATSEGGEKVYDLNQRFYAPSGGYNLNENYSGAGFIVVYPFWTISEYTITYHPNTGTGEDYTETVTWGTDVEVKGSDFFSKTGYHIGSWNESSNASGLLWVPGRTYTWEREENVDLYAIWEGDEYTVTYKDGSSDNITLLTDTAVYGSPYYTKRVQFPESRIYNSFQGWKADDNTILTEQDVWFGAYSYGSDPTWLLQRNLVLTPIFSDTYSFGKIFYGGKYSDAFGVYVSEPPSYQWAGYDYTHDKVPGRNGDVLRDPRRFENVERTYSISAYDSENFYSVAKKLSSWLNRKSSDKYMRLEDSYEPDIFRYAVYENSGELENIMAKAGQCELTFNCKPQRFLISGEREIKITQSGQIVNNPTDQYAYPIVTFRGTGEVYINGKVIVAYWNDNVLRLDCETLEAVDNSGDNMNPYIFTSDQIYLKPGNNEITFDEKISDVRIIPRWWIV